MNRPLFLGIDLGSTRVKAGLYDARGNQHGFALTDLGDSETWWPATLTAVRACLQGLDPSAVRGLCVGGQGPCLVAVDRGGQWVRPALGYDDTRAAPEAAWLSERLSRPVPLRGSYLPRAMWLRNHEADSYAATRWFLQGWDYLVYRLTGRAVATCPMGAYTPWQESDLVAAGLEPERFPPPVRTGEVAAALSASAAADTSLQPGIPVIAGGNDFLLATMGVAGARKGAAQSQGGATSAFTLCWDVPLQGEMIAWCIPSPIEPHLFNIGGPITSGGSALDWILRTVLGESADYETVLAAAGELRPGADGLLFWPYLCGEELTLGAEVRGAFLGLSLDHEAAHLVRAVLEGVALAGRSIMESLLQAGGRVDQVLTYGGQARSAVWNQMKADIWNRVVCTPQVLHVGCLGAAAIAAVGTGTYSSLSAASQGMAQSGREYAPNPANLDVYDEAYRAFAQIHVQVHGLFQGLHSLRAVRPAPPLKGAFRPRPQPCEGPCPEPCEGHDGEVLRQ